MSKFKKQVTNANGPVTPKQKATINRLLNIQNNDQLWDKVITRQGANLVIQEIKKCLVARGHRLNNSGTKHWPVDSGIAGSPLPDECTCAAWTQHPSGAFIPASPSVFVQNAGLSMPMGTTAASAQGPVAAVTAVAAAPVKDQVQAEEPATPQKAEDAQVSLAESLIPLQSALGIPDNLRAYIPQASDPDISLYQPKEEYRLLEREYRNDRSMLLIGEAGTGKTTMGRYLAYRNGVLHLLLSLDAMSALKEMFGQLVIKDGTSSWNPGLFTLVSQLPSIIHLAEVNAADIGRNFILHELLNNRMFFVKEADNGRGRVFKLHPRCYILLDGNPPNTRYPGSNRFNCATVSRVSVQKVKSWTFDDILGLINARLGNYGPEVSRLAKDLARFYVQWNEVILEQDIRGVFTLRELGRLMSYIDHGDDIKKALELSCLNHVELNDGVEAYKTGLGLASTIFNVSFDEENQNEEA